MLAEYTVEHKKTGWYFGRGVRFVSSVSLVIARQLKRQIAKRDVLRPSGA